MQEDQVKHLVWWARDKVRGFMTGLHKSPDFGYSLDFAQHRSYVPGDSPKFIDWSIVARQDKFLTKQYEAESNLRAYFVLDSSASMFVPEDSKWIHAVELLSLSAALLEKQRDALGLLEVSEHGVTFFEASNKKESLEQLLHHIQGREHQGVSNGDISAEIESLGGRIPRRSQVIMLTDLYHQNPKTVLEQLGSLKNAGHDITLAALVDSSKEQSSDALLGMTVLDPETGRKTVLDKGLLDLYLEFTAERLRMFSEESGARGFRFVQLDSSKSSLESFLKLVS